MDPMTAATLNATIVGLLCTFRQERRDRNDLTRKQFTDWLEAQHREDLKEIIIRSTELPSEIDRLLKKDVKELLLATSQMRATLASLPGCVDGLAKTIQSSQSQSDRLKMLFALIDKQEQAVIALEAQGFFLQRGHPDGAWELPVEVPELRQYYAMFEGMKVEDLKEWKFLVHEDASHKEHVHIRRGNRQAKMGQLLQALGKLIEYKDELDYLDQLTRTPRP
ncbi:MAG: hypothetical protein H7A43_11835 [Verrucomicrobia bacterium]|nr:hypothetical protein [Verrucomicrobiota bacterium]